VLGDILPYHVAQKLVKREQGRDAIAHTVPLIRSSKDISVFQNPQQPSCANAEQGAAGLWPCDFDSSTAKAARGSSCGGSDSRRSRLMLPAGSAARESEGSQSMEARSSVLQSRIEELLHGVQSTQYAPCIAHKQWHPAVSVLFAVSEEATGSVLHNACVRVSKELPSQSAFCHTL
jgi:hypothetical protein